MSHRGLSLYVPWQQGRLMVSCYGKVTERQVVEGRKEGGNTKEDKAVVTSEVKKDRER